MKRVICLALIGAMMFAFTGCKEEKQVTEVNLEIKKDDEAPSASAEETEEKTDVEEKTVDAAKIAEDLLTEISYTDELSSVDKDTASMFLNFADVEIEEAYIYESSGATAEEIVVLKCKDSDNAANAKDAFSQRVEEQIDNYTDYVPEEVPKLKDAVIITSKEYAVLSVSGDSGKAKSIIEDAFK